MGQGGAGGGAQGCGESRVGGGGPGCPGACDVGGGHSGEPRPALRSVWGQVTGGSPSARVPPAGDRVGGARGRGPCCLPSVPSCQAGVPPAGPVRTALLGVLRGFTSAPARPGGSRGGGFPCGAGAPELCAAGRAGGTGRAPAVCAPGSRVPAAAPPAASAARGARGAPAPRRGLRARPQERASRACFTPGVAARAGPSLPGTVSQCRPPAGRALH